MRRVATRTDGRVCVVGSLNIDLVTRVVTHPEPGETVRGCGLDRLPGGKGANQAVAAARAGARTRLVGRIGHDAGGQAYRHGLIERDVDCSDLGTVEGAATGHALIAVGDTGENTIIVVPGANATLTEDALDCHTTTIRSCDILLLQLEIPVPTVCRAAFLAAEAGARVILNASPITELPEDLLAIADPLIVNEHEAERLSGLAASTCMTLGAAGARWGDVVVPAPRIEPVDTTGAGDAFAGTLAAALAEGADQQAALHAAVRAATVACTWHGAQGWRL